MKRRIRHAVTLALVCSAATAHAQQTPSAAQIINALKPGNELGATAGSVAPPAAAAQPAKPPAATPRPAAPQPLAHQPAKPQITVSQPAKESPPKAPPAPAAAPSINLSIQFEPNSARLTPAAVRALDQLGKALTSETLAKYRFSIVGHTDTVGSPAANQALSVARADTVKSYLESKFGIDGSRLVASGVGETGLLVPTPPQTPNPANRRVQVINLGS